MDWVCDDRLNMQKYFDFLDKLSEKELEEFEKKNYTHEQLVKMFGYD